MGVIGAITKNKKIKSRGSRAQKIFKEINRNRPRFQIVQTASAFGGAGSVAAGKRLAERRIEKEPEKKHASLRKPPPPAGQLNAPKINEKPEEPQASKIEPRASKIIAMD